MAVPIPSRTKQSRSRRTCAITLAYPGKTDPETVLSRVPGSYTCDGGGQLPNRLYHDDNLSVLATLAKDTSVCGKVTLVYIDPPFATSGQFRSREMKYAFTDAVVGHEFVESLRHRLLFIHRLLGNHGSLYLHLDARMVHYMRVVLDEIFGRSNFRASIVRRKCNPKNYTRKTYGNIADYILFYSKTEEYTWNRPMLPWDPIAARKEYPYVDKDGRYHKRVPIHAPGIRNGATGEEWRGMKPPLGKHWQYRPERLEELDAEGKIYWSSRGNPRRRVFLDESLGRPVQNIWMDVRDAHNQNVKVTGYPTEKNPALLRRIVEASSNPGDLVLDCYSGSGTALAVAAELGRRWIGVDNSDEAIRVTLRRLRSGRGRMGNFTEGPGRQRWTLFEVPKDFGVYWPEGGKSVVRREGGGSQGDERHGEGGLRRLRTD